VTSSKPPHRSAGPWRVAEWITLVVSVLLLGGIAVHLVMELLRPASPFVVVETRLEVDHTQERGGRFLVPLTVRNHGDRTLTKVVVGIRPEGDPRPEVPERTVEVTYLAEGARRVTYLVFEHDPRTSAMVRADPLFYEVE
jgi:uncharacterized protein (TIGR02588 family)